MAKYIAVDCGKCNTKVKAYDEGTRETRQFKFRTRMSENAIFEDDMLEKGTYIVQVDDGPVCKIGVGARTDAALETSKKTDVHRTCTLAAAAMMVCENEPEAQNIVIGMPLQIASIAEERLAYKKYILGDAGDEHTVKLKTSGDGPVREVRLKFEKRLVYPEGIGVLYEHPSMVDGLTAILDLGHLNLNATYAQDFMVIPECSFTVELGGKILIASLAETLSAELGYRVDDNLAASLLQKPYEKRYLKGMEKESRELIDQLLLDHVKDIRRRCDTKHWPLQFMNTVCIGGTSKLLTRELKQIFGDDIFIPDAPEYVNVSGFLKKMCADSNIDITNLPAK